MAEQKTMRFVATNGKGLRVGETHHRAKYPDSLVDQVRSLHEEGGLGYGRIAKQLGLSKRTVRDWCMYERRAQSYEGWKRAD